MGAEIIVCGQRFAIDHQVITFEDPGGFDARIPHRTDRPDLVEASHPAPGMEGRALRYRPRRRLGREGSVDALRRAVRQVVVHFDGCLSATECFDVLHNQHGLSVHFLVDGDGTIYQTLDLRDCAFHAAGVNEVSVGIELQNRADALRFKGAYGGRRPTVVCTVHGVDILAYDFTDPQYEAMTKLGRALGRILDIPLESPTTPNGTHLWTTMDEPRRFAGFIGHYHVTRRKWDPGPWDFGRMFRRIAHKVTSPIPIGQEPSPLDQGAPSQDRPSTARGRTPAPRAPEPKRDLEVDDDAFVTQLDGLADKSGRRGLPGFPLGPFGRSRLWHGGVHLEATRFREVRAIAHGRVVVAKMADSEAIGSRSFVLVKHRFLIGDPPTSFFSLYYHLEPEAPDSSILPAWMQDSPEAHEDLAKGRTVLFDRSVDAGEVIGRVGVAGPRALRQSQLHFAVFSTENLVERVPQRIALDQGPGVERGMRARPGADGARRFSWRLVESGPDTRFCRVPEVIDLFDRPSGGRPRDGLVDRRELLAFFASSTRRRAADDLVIRVRAEWTPDGWDELERMQEWSELDPEELRRLIREQIEPTLWWTRQVAAHAGLPETGYVYAYHPLTFVAWYRRLLSAWMSERSAGVVAHVGEWTRGERQLDWKLDFESVEGMIDEEDARGGTKDSELKLEDMVRGYPE